MSEAFFFDPETHTYTLSGKRLPSVTELVSVFCSEEMDEDDTRIEAAAERGTVLHAYLAHRLTGGAAGDFELPDAYAGYAEAVELFLSEHTFEPWLIETAMYCRYGGLTFAGTPDFIGQFDGVAAILDYKFVSQLSKTKTGAQLAGYTILAESNMVYPDARYAVQFLSDGTYRLYPAGADSTDFDLCVKLYLAKHKKHPKGAIA